MADRIEWKPRDSEIGSYRGSVNGVRLFLLSNEPGSWILRTSLPGLPLIFNGEERPEGLTDGKRIAEEILQEFVMLIGARFPS